MIVARKSNIRSIRFSDELAELIDRQIGDTFTEKFENLITRCVWELPQKEFELEQTNKQIEEQRTRLAKLRKQAATLILYTNSIEEKLKKLEREVDIILGELEV